MTNEAQAAMDLLIHTLVDRIDELGQGVQAIEDLGPEKTRVLMDRYRAHEQREGLC